MCGLPEQIRLNLPSRKHLTAKVPKGHLCAHDDSCQGPYSLNYTKGAGQTDGEGIERLWSWLNKIAASVKEMTPAARQELIDDLCGFINWRKNIGLYDILARRMLDALKQVQAHWDELQAFSARVRERDAQQLQAWQRMVCDWQKDPSCQCPFTSSQPCMFLTFLCLNCLTCFPLAGVTFNAVRLAILREEEHEYHQQGRAIDNTPASFICLGIEVETMQYVAPYLGMMHLLIY